MNPKILLFLKKIKAFFIATGTILFLSGYIYLIYRIARKFPAGQPRKEIVLEMTVGVIIAGVILWGIIVGSINLIKWMREKWDETEHELELVALRGQAQEKKGRNLQVCRLPELIESTVDGLKKRIEAGSSIEGLKKRIEAERKEKEMEKMENRVEIKPEPKSDTPPEQPGGRYKIAIGKK